MTFALNDYPDDRVANSNTYFVARDSASSIPGILGAVLQDIRGRYGSRCHPNCGSPCASDRKRVSVFYRLGGRLASPRSFELPRVRSVRHSRKENLCIGILLSFCTPPQPKKSNSGFSAGVSMLEASRRRCTIQDTSAEQQNKPILSSFDELSSEKYLHP